MKRLDIGIAGAGPAGLASALLLARQGHRVEILERFADVAPVGSGLMLQPTGLTALAALGLLQPIMALGSRIDRLHGADARSGRTVLDVRYDALAGGRFGLAVQRAALFGVLHDAVTAAGIAIRTGMTLTAAKTSGEKAVLTDAAGQEAGRYDLVIDATGARSTIAAGAATAPGVRELAYGAFWATLDSDGLTHDPNALTQRYDRAKVGDADAVKAAGLDRWKAAIRDYWPDCAPLLDQIDDWDQLTLARYAHRTLRPPTSGRVAFVGDSAHSTSPQLGQGANMALIDAATLAHTLSLTDDIDAALAAYGRARRNHMALFQLLSLAFTPFYQSDSAALAWLRDRLVATIARIPPSPALLASIVSGTLIDPFAAAGLKECDWQAICAQPVAESAVAVPA